MRTFVVALLVGGIIHQSACSDEPTDLEKLQGEWLITRIEAKGKQIFPAPQTKLAKEAPSVMTIKKDQASLQGENWGTLVLQSTTPKKLDLIYGDGTVTRGIFRFDSDNRITLTWGGTTDEESARPKVFQTDNTSIGIRTLTLERRKTN